MHGHGYGDAQGEDGRYAVAGELGGELNEPPRLWIYMDLWDREFIVVNL